MTALNVSNNPFSPGIATDVYSPDQLIAGDLKLVTRNISVPQQSAVLPRGQVMGIISATGLAVPSVATATDGSQVPAGILADATDATAGQVTAGLYQQGEFNFAALTFDASWGAAGSAAALTKLAQAARSTLFFKVPVSADVSAND